MHKANTADYKELEYTLSMRSHTSTQICIDQKSRNAPRTAFTKIYGILQQEVNKDNMYLCSCKTQNHTQTCLSEILENTYLSKHWWSLILAKTHTHTHSPAALASAQTWKYWLFISHLLPPDGASVSQQVHSPECVWVREIQTCAQNQCENIFSCLSGLFDLTFQALEQIWKGMKCF